MKLALGRALYDPGDPMGKVFFNILATFSEFEADLIRMRTREGNGHRPRQGEIARQAAQIVRQAAAGTLPHACHRRVFHQRSRRAVLHLKINRLSHTQPAPFPLAYDPAPYRNRLLQESTSSTSMTKTMRTRIVWVSLGSSAAATRIEEPRKIPSAIYLPQMGGLR